MKKRVLLFSILGGIGFSIWFYSYYLLSIFPEQSALRIVLTSLALFASSLILYFLTKRVLLPFWHELSRSWRRGFLLASIVFGISFFLATVNFNYLGTRTIAFWLPTTISDPTKTPFYLGWLVPAILMIGIYIYLSLVIFAFVSSFKGVSAKPPEIAVWKELLFYAAPMMLVWGFYLLVFFPGRMGPDTITQWTQMVTWQFIDWHPPLHTLTYWLITRIWYSPAAIAIFQIIVLALAAAWGLVTIRHAGSPAWLTWFIVALLTLSPANGLFAITLWKDVLFSATVLILSVCILNIWITHGKWLENKVHWIGMAVILTLVSIYRQNGTLVCLGILPLLVISYRRLWKAFLKITILFIALFVFVKVPLYRALNVAPDTFHNRLPMIFANLIEAHIDAKTYFSKTEKAILTSVYLDRPIQYACYRNTEFVLDRVTDRNPLAEQITSLIKMAIRLTIRAPSVTIHHFTCNGDFVYRIFNQYPWYETIPNLRIKGNPYNLKLQSLIPSLASPIDQLVQSTVEDNNLSWFFWRMPLWMYLSLGGCIVFCLRQRTYKPFLILVPGLLATLPLIILSMGQIFRYVYSMYLCGMLMSGYFWTCNLPVSSEPVLQPDR